MITDLTNFTEQKEYFEKKLEEYDAKDKYAALKKKALKGIDEYDKALYSAQLDYLLMQTYININYAESIAEKNDFLLDKSFNKDALLAFVTDSAVTSNNDLSSIPADVREHILSPLEDLNTLVKELEKEQTKTITNDLDKEM